MTPVGFIQDDLELKLLILYIMNRVAAPITFLQLLDLALCDAGVNYFDVTQAVNHLVRTQHLELEGERYAITEKGRRNCQTCENSLPFSVRRRCQRNLAQLNAQLLRDAQVRGDLEALPDGTFTVKLALDDEKGSLLKLELLTPSETQAQQLIQRFKGHPEQVYNAVVDVLLSNSDDE